MTKEKSRKATQGPATNGAQARAPDLQSDHKYHFHAYLEDRRSSRAATGGINANETDFFAMLRAKQTSETADSTFASATLEYTGDVKRPAKEPTTFY